MPLSLISRIGGEESSVRYGRDDQKIYSSLTYGEVFLDSGQTVKQRYSAYLGPKKREDLKKLGVYLETSVDYGWFGLVALPLLWLLHFLQNIVGNWGIAILALTFLVKLALHPINKKSMESMKGMQKIQPKLKEIQNKYKDDKERLNAEMMNLFKAHKVNPMGGCLPMLIQMPVYFALYQVLWNSIELYHAPFFWFYKDLAAPDPFYISPILLAIFMVLQQRLTPSAATMDPAQQKIMMVMPLMFGLLFIYLPFGLILYIFANTVISVVQQYMIHREMSFVELVKRVPGKVKKKKS